MVKAWQSIAKLCTQLFSNSKLGFMCWSVKVFRFTLSLQEAPKLTLHKSCPNGANSSFNQPSSPFKTKTTFSFHLWTYPDKGPVTKVVDGAEEPEFVEEKIRPCHGALIWKRQEKHKNILLTLTDVYAFEKDQSLSTNQRKQSEFEQKEFKGRKK